MTDNISGISGVCFKCGKTSTAPCSDLDCNRVIKDSLYRRPTWISQIHIEPPHSMGCICPPTSEQTCMNPLCPRQSHTGKAK